MAKVKDLQGKCAIMSFMATHDSEEYVAHLKTCVSWMGMGHDLAKQYTSLAMTLFEFAETDKPQATLMSDLDTCVKPFVERTFQSQVAFQSVITFLQTVPSTVATEARAAWPMLPTCRR